MQFDVHEYNESGYVRLIVIVQSSIVDTPGRYMVIPLANNDDFSGRFIKDLFPILTVNGERFRLMTPEVVSIPENLIGDKVGTLVGDETKIKDALNLLFWGI